MKEFVAMVQFKYIKIGGLFRRMAVKGIWQKIELRVMTLDEKRQLTYLRRDERVNALAASRKLPPEYIDEETFVIALTQSKSLESR